MAPLPPVRAVDAVKGNAPRLTLQQVADLEESAHLLRRVVASMPAHPHIGGIGMGKNLDRWWLETALERVTEILGQEG